MQCRSCKSENLERVVNLGEQYVSDFREDDSKPNKYPIIAVICHDCMLVQLDRNTPREEMYHDNYGFKSGVSDSIKDDLKDVVKSALNYRSDPENWLDIASNDGTLLSYVPKETYRVGIDPVAKYCKEAEKYGVIINDYFNYERLETRFDVITSISVFYDMPDPNKFVGDVKKALKDDGIWVIQQNYLLPTMELGAVDNFCHEHLEYYTLLSLEPLLERHGLEVVDLSTSDVNGGSIRTYVAHKGVFPTQDSVEQQRTIEKSAGLDDVQTYMDFASNAMTNIQELRALVETLVADGKRVCILAASTRGATIWQCAGLGPDLIEYAVERNPEKVGKYFSAIGVKIVSEAKFREDKPDYALMGPWFFFGEIVTREKQYLQTGGRIIKPLPVVEVIEWQSSL